MQDAQRTTRCFAAVNLPAHLKDFVATEQARIRSQINSHAFRFVLPEQLHLTLLFIGDLAVDKLDQAKDALTKACENHSRFELTLSSPGCFPNPRRPKVLWLGIGGELNALHTLQESVSHQLSLYVQKQDNKTFHPHLTLARIKFEDKELSRNLSAYLTKAHEEPAFPESAWEVNSIELMRSELTPSGSKYFVEHSVLLGE